VGFSLNLTQIDLLPTPQKFNCIRPCNLNASELTDSRLATQKDFLQMIREVFMPALSSTMTEGKIVSWVKSAGDKVEKGETVVVVESDKADMDVESFYEGYLAIIIVPAGEVAPVGAAIALVAETEAEIAVAQQQGGAAPSAAAAPAKSPAPVSAATSSAGLQQNVSRQNGRSVVSPRARKLAKEFKVDLNSIKGSGPNGRIVAEDVEAAAGKAQPAPVQQSVTVPAAPAPGTLRTRSTRPRTSQTRTRTSPGGGSFWSKSTDECAAKCRGAEYGSKFERAVFPRRLHNYY
jgi:pyruvate/2-oxoglutarate dehydrogenase complex dihydrolipoamide acyltransferase (E2) component